MLTEMMSRSVISSPPVDTSASASVLPLLRSPTPVQSSSASVTTGTAAGPGTGTVGAVMMASHGCPTGPALTTRPQPEQNYVASTLGLL